MEKEINIVALEFPENVRTRPGMFVGAMDRPGVILREAVDNAVDELMGSSSGTSIDIQLKEGRGGGYYVVSDNGRGIPILLDKARGITKTELAVGTLNAGSKFVKGDDDVSTGLNGVGIACTNALSESFVVLSRITRENYSKSIPAVKKLYRGSKSKAELFYVLEYKKGVKVFESALAKGDVVRRFKIGFPDRMSTVVAFRPDGELWESVSATYSPKSLAYVKIILDRFYRKKCEITIDGQRVDQDYQPLRYEFLREIAVGSGSDRRSARFLVNFEVSKDLSVEEYGGSVNSLVVDRGVHINWATDAFTAALRERYDIAHEHLREGLTMNVIVLSSDADYSSQTKERCVKVAGLSAAEVVPELAKEFHRVFRAHAAEFELHVERLNEYAAAMDQISAINLVKQAVGTVDGGNRVRSKLPSSVKDAASNDRMKCELFICEGKSALGTMIKSRDPEIHALMGLRGVPLNSVNLDLDSIMGNAEMRGIVIAVGYGTNEYNNLASCRYGKIVLAADADIDGSRINALLLGFIAKKMTGLIEEGRVFVAVAPLYIQGKTYVYPGEDPRGIIDMGKPFKRIKGLGELNTDEAKEFFFNPKKRRLVQITSNNLEYVFDLLTSSPHRKDLMVQAGVIIDKYKLGIL